MQRIQKKITEINSTQLLQNSCNSFNTIAYLKFPSSFLAVGAAHEFLAETHLEFSTFQSFLDNHKSHTFGYFSYDVKNSIEQLQSNNQDALKFPLAYFFVPKFLFEINEETTVHYFEKDAQELEQLLQATASEIIEKPSVSWQPKITKETYLETVKNIKQHIRRGDAYELNFCYEFFAENAHINPVNVFLELDAQTKAPFGSFLKIYNNYSLSFSPEHYLKKEGKKIISQPIKGTAQRGATKEEDEQIKYQLQHNKKEQNENVMIVDLVRNDLSITAAKNSVKVDELFGVYTFETVHQMISTISSEIKEEISATDVIKTTFPMGSMTGAPKISAMQLIEKYENTKRGLYSGAIGYFTPEQDFDFSVVIRTLLFNSENNYLSLMVGSAITDACNPEDEYQETLLKADKFLRYFVLDTSR
jgi:para-aminobenzoate synthetase component I